MKSRIYVKNDTVKKVELDVSMLEYLVLQEAITVLFQDADMSASDRYLAASMLDDWNDNREIIDVAELS